jgi:hypothetical protein
VSSNAERNFESNAVYHESGHESSILVADAWDSAREPILFASQSHLSEATAPYSSNSTGPRRSDGGTEYSTGNPYVTNMPLPTSPLVYLHHNQSADAATTSDSNHSNHKTISPWLRHARIFGAVVIVAVITVAILFGVCGTNGCRRESNDPITNNIQSFDSNVAPTIAKPTVRPTAALSVRPTLPPTATPTASPTDSREANLVDYINSITLANRTIARPDPNLDLAVTPPEELALQWIIQHDPMQLSPDSAANQFRIRQRYALKTLWVQRAKNPFDGSNMDECTWTGILCTKADLGSDIGTQRAVTELDLRNAARPSFLPDDLGLLSHLTTVDMTQSKLFGTLPASIGLWTDLVNFYGQWNQLTGSLPSSIGNWTNLSGFYVNNNTLTGTWPESIAQ